MAVKSPKEAVATLQPKYPNTSAPLSTIVDIEGMIADELLDSVDWQLVKVAFIEKAKAKFWQWVSKGGDRPVNISQFPELSALPSSQDGEAA
ncbi:hypothetical protein H6F42_21605 [Pseudanabaena sp. FACHB-1998]|uniref:hypothetical protein n=1 Tax=Pseudanabaena sp. FACHB-1998 TaxID=2692858 RepID=UPI001681AB2F|nr:hypothetical protein [Pseudanabaena sp. FACHB-1998]MBD2179513.1 hypothetical protein [Pseudanabaena sp. FACHB-1998]